MFGYLFTFQWDYITSLKLPVIVNIIKSMKIILVNFTVSIAVYIVKFNASTIVQLLAHQSVHNLDAFI